MVLVLLETYELRVSQETVRRGLHKEQIGWRRPRPIVGSRDPQREEKLQALRQLLATLPANEIAVFQDEVDINTNPKIGAMWMRRGQQAAVVTPGTNEKRYLAGSLNWRTGALLLTQGLPKEGRTAALFIRHLEDGRQGECARDRVERSELHRVDDQRHQGGIREALQELQVQSRECARARMVHQDPADRAVRADR